MRWARVFAAAFVWSCSPYTFTSGVAGNGAWEIASGGTAAPIDDARHCSYVGRLLAHGDASEIKSTLRSRVARYGGTHFRIEEQSGSHRITVDGKKLKLEKSNGGESLSVDASVWQCPTKPDGAEDS